MTKSSEKLVRDAFYITCLECREELVSLFRHDFQKCSCSAGAYIDGGQGDYYRVGGAYPDKIKVGRADFLVDEKAGTRVRLRDGDAIYIEGDAAYGDNA